MRHFCTYFDRNYAARGLTLCDSLAQQYDAFTLWVLCLDDTIFDILTRLNLSHLKPVRFSDLEQFDPELAAVKPTRSAIEYYFTSSACWIRYVLHLAPDTDFVTYVDADLYFYRSPETMYDELGSGSVLIIPHNFGPEGRWRAEKYGFYNVGLLIFRRDECGLACLNRWREQCIEWCYDRVEEGRFADQKYLDQWPANFKCVVVSTQKGANLAPWNWMNYQVAFQDKDHATVDGEPLIFYHFHGIRQVNGWLFDARAGAYRTMPRSLVRPLYHPYLAEMKRQERKIQRVLQADGTRYVSTRHGHYRIPLRNLVWKLLHGELEIIIR